MYYAITTIGDTHHEEQEPYRYRTVGIFTARDLALEVPRSNLGDLHEDGWYDWLVIENMPYGLYPVPKETIWYEWKDDKWQQIDGPPKFMEKFIKDLVAVGSIG